VPFETGTARKITRVGVNDGDMSLLLIDQISTGGGISYGVEINLLLHFENTGPNAWCSVVNAS
jgi:hypothetical protein